ncbi:MAG: hypothetical protein KAT68_11285 [Bacteroidales bacterium]|nr:hypothetical protein [Bacteroidales bacterium]
MNNQKKSIFINLIFILISNILFSQPEYLFLNNDLNFRYENIIYNDKQNFHTSVKPYFIPELSEKKNIDSSYINNSNSPFIDFINNKTYLNYLANDNIFYIKPIVSYTAIYEQNPGNIANSGSVGLTIIGNFNKKLSLQTNIIYNNCCLPEHQANKADSIGVIPHFGKFNSYYFSNTYYLSYSPVHYFNVQAGNGKIFFGDGYMSLLLSDNSNFYPFLKLSLNAWKIKYISLFTLLKDIDYPDIEKYYEKYSAIHYLSWNISKKFNINLFETVIWGGNDTVNYRFFDINYLNPVIFYRPVEFSLDNPSPDNVLMGMGFRWNVWKKNHLYGQLILDEFKLSEVRAGNGWWANKHGFQLGLKAFKFLSIENLFFLAEFNFVRPFTYSHISSLQNYGHYYQPLAHPLGANFEENVLLLKYKHKNWFFEIKNIYSLFGTDTNNVNLGHNIYKSYVNRYNEYNNNMLQGEKNNLFFSELKISYLINPKINLQFETGLKNRTHIIENKKTNNMYFFIGFRTTIFNNELVY